jgi:hypothetical protein
VKIGSGAGSGAAEAAAAFMAGPCAVRLARGVGHVGHGFADV